MNHQKREERRGFVRHHGGRFWAYRVDERTEGGRWRVLTEGGVSIAGDNARETVRGMVADLGDLPLEAVEVRP